MTAREPRSLMSMQDGNRDLVPSTYDERPLPTWLRATLVVAGLGFLLIGVVMLAIPVLPQVWAFALALVCFSLASRALWLWLERKLQRWPRIHDATAALRSNLLRRLSSR